MPSLKEKAITFERFSIDPPCEGIIDYEAFYLNPSSTPLPQFITFDPLTRTILVNTDNKDYIGSYFIKIVGRLNSLSYSSLIFNLKLIEGCSDTSFSKKIFIQE